MITKRRSYFRTAIVLAGAIIVAASTVAIGQMTVYRISSAQQLSGEIATSSAPPGTSVYFKTFYHPGNMTYVTFNAQADVHSDAGLMMECLFDGMPCEMGGGAADSGGGAWSLLQKLTTDSHDNSITKVWCLHNHPGTHHVELRLASSGGGTVFYERGTIFIDGSTGTSSNLSCAAPTPPAPGALRKGK